ncbi:hypothetical protein BGW37DRAFT_301568 [Umbelopsis sp. PMI_123]|nr:hypothetical protein BGW37DRAFT_301568 [Umbelopsis sp. PMI_123]
MTIHILNMTHAEFDLATVYLSDHQSYRRSKVRYHPACAVVSTSHCYAVFQGGSKGLFCTSSTFEKTLGDRQGKARLWFISSYAWTGISLLEGGVASAEKVAVEGIGRLEDLDVVILLVTLYGLPFLRYSARLSLHRIYFLFCTADYADLQI